MKSAPASRRDLEVGDVLGGDRGQVRPRERDVHALASADAAAGDDARDDIAVAGALDRQSRDAVADDDLRALGHQAGEAAEVDHGVVVGAGPLAIAEDEPVAHPQHALGRVGASGAAWVPAGRTTDRADGPRAPPRLGPRPRAVGGRRRCRASSSGGRSRARPRRARRALPARRSRVRGSRRSWSGARARSRRAGASTQRRRGDRGREEQARNRSPRQRPSPGRDRYLPARPDRPAPWDDPGSSVRTAPSWSRDVTPSLANTL